MAKKAERKNASKKSLTDRTILIRIDLDTGKRFFPKHWEDVKKHFKEKCVYCGEEKKLVKEHAIPINRKYLGLHRHGNVVPACADCNQKKGANHYIVFCRNEAINGEEAKNKIEDYMKSKGYKGIGKDKAERDKIRNVIDEARKNAGNIRNEAVAKIKKIVKETEMKKKHPKWAQNVDKIWNKIQFITEKRQDNPLKKYSDPKKAKKEEDFIRLMNECIAEKDAQKLHDEAKELRQGLWRDLAKMIIDLEQNTSDSSNKETKPCSSMNFCQN